MNPHGHAVKLTGWTAHWLAIMAFCVLLTGFQANCLAVDYCSVCGKPLSGEFYFMTDMETGQKEMVCSNCATQLPRCYLCGMPIKKGDEVQLPDGRFLCARDASNVVLDPETILSTCQDVRESLNRLFSRFTTFPSNVDVSATDKMGEDDLLSPAGRGSASPDLLGWIRPVFENGRKWYKMSLMTGLPPSELRETCAHELSHAWVGENVPEQRHRHLERDTEEGFCEMIGYLFMDSEGNEDEKRRVLANLYTRGQVNVFVAAEQEYGIESIFEWMQRGLAPRLDMDHLEEINNVAPRNPAYPVENLATLPYSAKWTVEPATIPKPVSPPSPALIPSRLELEGVIWGGTPSAIINGRTFFVDDIQTVGLAGTNLAIRCEAIGPATVKIRRMDTGVVEDLRLQGH